MRELVNENRSNEVVLKYIEELGVSRNSINLPDTCCNAELMESTFDSGNLTPHENTARIGNIKMKDNFFILHISGLYHEHKPLGTDLYVFL